MLKTAFSIALFVAASSAATLGADELKFVKYISEFGKHYEGMNEFLVRQKHFLRKDKVIEEHNAQKANFTLAHNKFSDFTPEEWSKMLGGKDSASPNDYCAPPPSSHSNNLELPGSVNWVKAGKTTPIKD